MTKARIPIVIGVVAAVAGGLVLALGGEETCLYAVSLIAVGAVLFLASQFIPSGAPASDPNHFVVTFTVDNTIDPPNIKVEPEIVVGTKKGDIVVFNNMTKKEVTVDFTIPSGIGSPFEEHETFKISGNPNENNEGATISVEAPIQKDAYNDFPYDVTTDSLKAIWKISEALSQSPRIRVGPRKE